MPLNVILCNLLGRTPNFVAEKIAQKEAGNMNLAKKSREQKSPPTSDFANSAKAALFTDRVRCR